MYDKRDKGVSGDYMERAFKGDRALWEFKKTFITDDSQKRQAIAEEGRRKARERMEREGK
jgi:hypothetical protein